LGLGAAMALGASSISSEAGYAGVGPNFLPWVVALVLCLLGAWMVWEAATGGFRAMEEASGAERADWAAFVWVSVGILANAALITSLGFILSCTLCFALAVRGFTSAEGQRGRSLKATMQDVLVGFLIAAPVYWMFTKLLAINLPGLTQTGWL
jgi:putative tricarboxylic transport membrane protein